MDQLDIREVARGREQIVHERAGEELAFGVIGELLQQRAAQSLIVPPRIWPSTSIGFTTTPQSCTTTYFSMRAARS
jgi:hypothetical protein